MKISSRAQRMVQFKKLHGKAGLNLVSLMDIFTILVFFLLVSSSNIQQLPNNKKITLPTSVAEKLPKETIVIAITKTAILVQGVEVAKIDIAIKNEKLVIVKLEQELKFHASKVTYSSETGEINRSVTIMGDENVPYQLLRKILASCRQANYTQIAFAVLQKAKDKD